jgi:hypothetical protein
VLLLPYLGEQGLYGQFHLDEPWDSAHNQGLINRMPSVYGPVTDQETPEGTTVYQTFVGPGTLVGDWPRTARELKEARGQILVVVEAGEALPWTKPADIAYAEGRPVAELGAIFRRGSGILRLNNLDGFHGVRWDGSIEFFRRGQLDEESLRRLIRWEVGPSSGLAKATQRQAR